MSMCFMQNFVSIFVTLILTSKCDKVCRVTHICFILLFRFKRNFSVKVYHENPNECQENCEQSVAIITTTMWNIVGDAVSNEHVKSKTESARDVRVIDKLAWRWKQQ